MPGKTVDKIMVLEQKIEHLERIVALQAECINSLSGICDCDGKMIERLKAKVYALEQRNKEDDDDRR